jgi:hypothetical protein
MSDDGIMGSWGVVGVVVFVVSRCAMRNPWVRGRLASVWDSASAGFGIAAWHGEASGVGGGGGGGDRLAKKKSPRGRAGLKGGKSLARGMRVTGFA